jgi:predicted SnoaL-like aldol condensation-catalyzing enzyme
MRELANADYIQHNPFIPTGLEPFIEMLPVLAEAGTTAENIRMFEDGNYVFMHNIWRNAEPFGAPEMVSFDIIRVDENGKVAEHWDALQPLVSETVSGRTQTDGPTEVTDLDQTEANKALAVALVRDVPRIRHASPTTSVPRATPSTTRSSQTGLRGSSRRSRR